MKHDLEMELEAKMGKIIKNSLKRKPLTDEEIKDLMPIRQDGWNDETMLLWMARAVERAHGIGI